MLPLAKRGKRSTALIALALGGGLALIAGLVELAGAIVPAPERPAAFVDSGEPEPPLEPKVVKIDDHSVEVSVGILHVSTIRLGEDESVDPLVDCLRDGIERIPSEPNSGVGTAPRRGWLHDPLRLRMNQAVQRVQDECLTAHVPRLRLPALPEIREIRAEGPDPDVPNPLGESKSEPTPKEF